MQPDAVAELGKRPLRELGLMDAVVVEHDVYASSGALLRGEQPEQVAEQGGILAVRTGRVETAGAHVERTREVELLVLARRHDAPLLATQHPVPAVVIEGHAR